jgi:hypothetical protein
LVSPGAASTNELRAQLDDASQQLDLAEREKSFLSEKVQAVTERSAHFEDEKKRCAVAHRKVGVQGKILAVNQAYNFVVLNLSGRNGVEPQSEMLVVRDGTSLEKSAFLQLNWPPQSAISLPAHWRVESKCNLETLSYMLAQIRKQEKKVATVLLLVATGLLVSCASQKDEVALVKDPDAKPEGAIPWNKQEKWEGGGTQFANMTDHR